MNGIKKTPMKTLRVIGAIWLALLAVEFLSLGVANLARADQSYYNFDASHPYYSDTQYGNLCWAAAAANVLAFTNWGPPNSQVIFDEFRANLPDQPSQMVEAYSWYFDKYYGKTDMWSFLEMNYGNYPAEIRQHINEKDGIDIAVLRIGGGMGHALAVWGYDLSDTGVLDAVWVTNSWGNPALTRYPVWYEDGYERIGFYSDGYIGWMDVLDPKPDFVPDNPVPPPSAPGQGDPGTVPEPSTMLLLVFGTAGMAGLNRKFMN